MVLRVLVVLALLRAGDNLFKGRASVEAWNMKPRDKLVDLGFVGGVDDYIAHLAG